MLIKDKKPQTLSIGTVTQKKLKITLVFAPTTAGQDGKNDSKGEGRLGHNRLAI